MAKKILSIELPQESNYRLTKKKSINADSWVISTGDFVHGELRSNPIKVGERCCVGRGFRDVIDTSIVKEIKVFKGSTKIILYTENSIYELVEVDEQS